MDDLSCKNCGAKDGLVNKGTYYECQYCGSKFSKSQEKIPILDRALAAIKIEDWEEALKAYTEAAQYISGTELQFYKSYVKVRQDLVETCDLLKRTQQFNILENALQEFDFGKITSPKDCVEIQRVTNTIIEVLNSSMTYNVWHTGDFEENNRDQNEVLRFNLSIALLSKLMDTAQEVPLSTDESKKARELIDNTIISFAEYVLEHDCCGFLDHDTVAKCIDLAHQDLHEVNPEYVVPESRQHTAMDYIKKGLYYIVAIYILYKLASWFFGF